MFVCFVLNWPKLARYKNRQNVYTCTLYSSSVLFLFVFISIMFIYECTFDILDKEAVYSCISTFGSSIFIIPVEQFCQIKQKYIPLYMSIQIKNISTIELYSVHCVHIPPNFTSCQFWPIQGQQVLYSSGITKKNSYKCRNTRTKSFFTKNDVHFKFFCTFLKCASQYITLPVIMSFM